MSTLDKLLVFAGTLSGLLIIVGIFTIIAAVLFPLFVKNILIGGVFLASNLLWLSASGLIARGQKFRR